MKWKNFPHGGPSVSSGGKENERQWKNDRIFRVTEKFLKVKDLKRFGGHAIGLFVK